MKKALISLLLGITLVGGLVGCGSKPVVEPVTEQTQEEKVEENKLTKEDNNIQENKEEVLDGTIENIIHRPNGDYSLKFRDRKSVV